MSGPEPVIRVKNRDLAANTYLVRTASPGECLLIDPGLDREAIAAALERAALVPVAIFATHGHFDHIGSAEHFRRTYAVDLHLHPADDRGARSSNFLMMAFKLSERIDPPKAFVPLESGFTWSQGADTVTVVHVPGHTPGSVILDVNGRLFSGDTIYRDDVWLTKLPDGDRPALVDSVRGVWDAFPDGAEVLPGHGGGATFGEIKRSNAPLRELLGLVGSANHD